MIINKSRKWGKPDTNGVVRHIKEQPKEVEGRKMAEEFILHKLDDRNEKKHGTWKWKDINKLEPHLPSFSEIVTWLNEYASQFPAIDLSYNKHLIP
jgi:nucleoid-associated protein YejK